MPSSDTYEQLNNIQRRDAFDRFSLLLQKFPALSEVVSAKKVKKEHLGWGDFQNIWRKDPTFPFEEAWDAYEKAYLANNNPSPEAGSETKEEDEEKNGKGEDGSFYHDAVEDSEKSEKNNERDDEKDKSIGDESDKINEFDASELNAPSREKLLEKMRNAVRSTTPSPNTRAEKTGLSHAINPAPQAIVGRRYANRARDEKGGVRIPGVGRYGRRLGKKIAKKGISKVLGRRLTQQIATRLASIVARLSLSSPHGMVITAVVLVVIFLILLIAFLFFKSTSYDFENKTVDEMAPIALPGTNTPGGIPGLQLDLSGPEEVENGENIIYSIDVSYTGNESVVVVEKIPARTVFVSATGDYTVETDDTGAVIELRWSLRENGNTSGSENTSSTQVNYATYTQSPYYLPSANSQLDEAFTPETIERANKLGSLVSQYQSYLISQAPDNNPKYVDPFLAVAWTVAIEGSGADPYSWNCNDVSFDINEGCVGWFNSGDWQVGGIQVSQTLDHLVDDFKAVYDTTDAQTVKRVGQAIIDRGNISNPITFPALSLEEIIAQAGSPGTPGVRRPTTPEEAHAQQLIAILLMDPAINAINLSLEVAGDVARQDNWRATMEAFGEYYSSNMQNFANRINALTKVYTGSLDNVLFNGSFNLTVSPADDSYIENEAVAVTSVTERSDTIITRVGTPTGNDPSTSGDIPTIRPSDYRQALIDEFGVTMNGFSNEQNMWAWEFMHKVSDTRLPEYVRGTVVGVNDSGSYQAGCKEIYLRSTYNTRDLFTVIFTHEMGHVVYHCSEGGNTQRRQAHLEALRVEGPVSSYGRQMCYYGGDTSALVTENWAEMVAAYLNPNSLTYAACSADPNPFANGRYPMHYAVAQEIFSK